MISAGNKKYIILSGLIMMLLVLVFGLLFPLFLSIKKDSDEVIFNKKEISSSQNKISSLNNIIANYEVFQSNIEKIDLLFIDQKEPLNFISFLEKTAEKLGLDIDIFINNKIQKSDLPGLDFQITASGPFNDLIKFLEKLESANYLVSVNSLNLQNITESETDSKGKKTQKDYIQANVDINVISRP